MYAAVIFLSLSHRTTFSPVASCPADVVACTLNDVAHRRSHRTLEYFPFGFSHEGFCSTNVKHTLFFHPYFARIELEREEQLAALIVRALACAATDDADVGREKV